MLVNFSVIKVNRLQLLKENSTLDTRDILNFWYFYINCYGSIDLKKECGGSTRPLSNKHINTTQELNMTNYAVFVMKHAVVQSSSSTDDVQNTCRKPYCHIIYRSEELRVGKE